MKKNIQFFDICYNNLRVVKFKYTSRNIYIMIKNKEKILLNLKEIKGSITTTALAEKTGIDITNISRYTKALEKEGLVERKIEQKGRLRLVNISLLPEKLLIETKIVPEKKGIVIPSPPKTLHPPKTVITEIDTKEDEFFSVLAQTTEFKRFIYRVLYGKVHRTEKRDGNLEEKVKIGLATIRDPSFSNVLKEMQDNFKNGIIKPSQIESSTKI